MSAEPGRIGVAISSYNRPDLLAHTLQRFQETTPSEIPIIVVDDGSDDPVPDADHRFDQNRGIAAAKNKGLELLDRAGVDHMFLFDSDTYPLCPQWWVPYVESPEPHLMYQFGRAPSHWDLHVIATDDDLISYDRSRGCMLYVHRSVLPVVGGMHLAWGKHGGEHDDFSMRIHQAGLTRFPYADVRVRTVECLDETKPGISSVDWNRHQHWKTVRADTLPRYAEYRELPVPVLVPRRADHGYRDEVWKFLQDRYWSGLPYRIVEGEHAEGPFNRSAGINAAAREAGNWDVAVIADADTWVPSAQLADAVGLARATGRLVSALTSVVELSEDFTAEVIRCGTIDPFAMTVDRVRVEEMVTQSSMLVVPRTLFDRIGGFDENFVGWSAEDNAAWRTASLVGGEPLRVRGCAFHLWHPVTCTRTMDDPHYRANQMRWKRYLQAKTADQILAVRNSP